MSYEPPISLMRLRPRLLHSLPPIGVLWLAAVLLLLARPCCDLTTANPGQAHPSAFGSMLGGLSAVGQTHGTPAEHDHCRLEQGQLHAVSALAPLCAAAKLKAPTASVSLAADLAIPGAVAVFGPGPERGPPYGGAPVYLSTQRLRI